MKSFAEFKKTVGYSCNELEKITGYTRQGLYYAFEMMDEGRKPSKQFNICVNAAIDKKIEEETKRFTERMDQLKELQDKFKEGLDVKGN